MIDQASNERFFRRLLTALSAVAALAAATHFALSGWSRHAITQVEAIVATHATMLAGGEGIYYDLNAYPFTVSPYGPIFYSLSAMLRLAGLPALLAGRLLSILALIGIVVVAYRMTRLITGSRYAAWTAALLAGGATNLLHWGTVGQVDVLALFFAFTGFYFALSYCQSRELGFLPLAGLFIALAIFTKQTFIASGCAVVFLLLAVDRRTAFKFVGALAVPGLAIAAVLSLVTGGDFFANTVSANLNPFSLDKLAQQAEYFAIVAGPVALIVSAGVKQTSGLAQKGLYVYLGGAGLIWLLTASKVGSDLNYQTETFVLLAVAAAVSLDRLKFFELLFAGDKSWVTLLQVPLLLYCVMNIVLSGRDVLTRVAREQIRRIEASVLAERVDPASGPILSVQIDPLLHARGRLEVEPLIYTLLVDAGLSDPKPLLDDIALKRFSSVMLYQDLFAEDQPPRNPELPSLPDDHLDLIREEYRLVEHVPGPFADGLFVYEPRQTPSLTAEASGVRVSP